MTQVEHNADGQTCNHNDTLWLGKTETEGLTYPVRWCRKCGVLRHGGEVVLPTHNTTLQSTIAPETWQDWKRLVEQANETAAESQRRVTEAEAALGASGSKSHVELAKAYVEAQVRRQSAEAALGIATARLADIEKDAKTYRDQVSFWKQAFKDKSADVLAVQDRLATVEGALDEAVTLLNQVGGLIPTTGWNEQLALAKKVEQFITNSAIKQPEGE